MRTSASDGTGHYDRQRAPGAAAALLAPTRCSWMFTRIGSRTSVVVTLRGNPRLIVTRPTDEVFADLIAAGQLLVVWRYDNATSTWASYSTRRLRLSSTTWPRGIHWTTLSGSRSPRTSPSRAADPVRRLEPDLPGVGTGCSAGTPGGRETGWPLPQPTQVTNIRGAGPGARPIKRNSDTRRNG